MRSELLIPADEGAAGRARLTVATLSGGLVLLGCHAAGLSGTASAAGLAVFAAGLAVSPAASWLASRLRPGDGPPSREARPDATTLEGVCDLVTWHDAQGDVVQASAAAAEVAGTPPSRLLGGGLLSRVHVSDRPAFLKALSDAANGPGTATVEFRLHAGRRAGAREDDEASFGPSRVVWAEMRVRRLARPEGAVLVAVTRDMSGLHRQADESERARAKAERADEVKGRFLATVSHELRTPLNAIIGFSELLAVDHPYVLTEERRKEYAVIIRNSGNHLLEIVNTLLDMSKIETGNFAFDPEPFGFRELAASCCDLMQLKAEGAGVTLVRRLDAELPEILADRRACRQILINLLSNAVKFTPAGGRVTVSVVRQGDALLLEVADTGIGIPETDLPRIGDAFFQSGDVHRRTHEGTGLGLSVVRGLIGLHRGTLRIESGTGVGTTVGVSLPIRGAEDPRSAAPVAVTARPRPARHQERMSA